jgi:hypothetical protein
VEEDPPPGLAAFVRNAIELTDDDLRKDLYNNIVLSGTLPLTHTSPGEALPF